jgi:hypothetical protein
MSQAPAHYTFDNREALFRFIAAGLVTGVSDGFFSSVLAVAAYGSTFSRLWQGVAATIAGSSAFTGGARTTALGLLIHFGVAFGWSAVFVFAVMRSAWIQRVLASRFGPAKLAALYGPAIWMIMSLAVIPLLVHRPPSITMRWWIQFFGHFPFVGLPIVALASMRTARSGVRAASAAGTTD